MSANTWYRPSKTKALGLAIVYAVVSIVLIWFASATSIQLCGFTGAVTVMVSLVYLMVFLSKVSRDGERAKQEIERRYVAAEYFEVPAPKTTPGNRIFMPSQSADAGNRLESL